MYASINICTYKYMCNNKSLTIYIYIYIFLQSQEISTKVSLNRSSGHF